MNSLNPLLHRNADYLALVAGAIVILGLLHLLFWRKSSRSAVSVVVWVLSLLVLGGGWYLVDQSGRSARQLMRQMSEGYAPTFAREMQRLGHEQITEKTSPEDTRYWQLIEAEKRWLKVNPSISDIFTLRKLRDGRVVQIVDSETDHNRDGVFDGEREQRVPIGAAYTGEAARGIEAALAGETVFLDTPYTDQWGTWVSALAPMRNFKGSVEGVLVVNFDASTWVTAITRARLVSIAGIGVLLLVIAGAGTALAGQSPRQERAPYEYVPRAPAVQEPIPQAPAPAPEAVVAPAPAAPEPAPEPKLPEPKPIEAVQPDLTAQQPDLTAQLREQEAVNIEKQKLETLVNSIDGIVWERNAVTSNVTFVSRQAERLLGYPPEEWMAKADFWQSKIHPDDSIAFAQRETLVAAKAPYSCDYRMIAADGHTVWIRENAAVLLDEVGAPLLVRGVLYDISAQKKSAEELDQANAALVDSSRFAGMAEVATGVLHNVGNVLNSVNVSGNVISDRLRKSKVIELGKVAGLLTLQAADFAGFVARDPRGPHVPELISCIADALKAEHADLLEEVEAITRNIAHIKEIVSMQQGFAKGGGIVEPISVQTLVDDAIKINSASFTRHRIAVVQAYEEVPKVVVDKHLVLQILVNLLRNAKQAIQESGIDTRRIVVKIQSKDGDFVRVAVQDTGMGIAPENLTRIFSHGFTTKKTGHGFGLHSSALAATGMGGSLNATSDGPGTGATFLLELPVYQPAPVAAAA